MTKKGPILDNILAALLVVQIIMVVWKLAGTIPIGWIWVVSPFWVSLILVSIWNIFAPIEKDAEGNKNRQANIIPVLPLTPTQINFRKEMAEMEAGKKTKKGTKGGGISYVLIEETGILKDDQATKEKSAAFIYVRISLNDYDDFEEWMKKRSAERNEPEKKEN